MRVWDIHPGYLSRESLLGQHVEIHAVFSVITGEKCGYAHHPETMRWRRNLHGLKQGHDLTVREMALRGYGHRSPLPEVKEEEDGLHCWVDPPHLQFGLLQAKYATRGRAGRIPLPPLGSRFWAHHKYGVMARGYSFYREIQSLVGAKEDLTLEREEDLVRRVLEITRRPVSQKALLNTLDHLWGYFKNRADAGEKQVYLSRHAGEPALLLPFFYALACKYDLQYLRHSTIFADNLG